MYLVKIIPLLDNIQVITTAHILNILFSSVMEALKELTNLWQHEQPTVFQFIYLYIQQREPKT